MNQRELYEQVQSLEMTLYGGKVHEREIAPEEDQYYVYFKPSQHFIPSEPLITVEVLENLRADKNVLSVGCGPAYLEKLLLALGVPYANITVSDIDRHEHVGDLTYHHLNYTQPFPPIGPFDYIIFSQSIFISLGNSIVCDDKDRILDRQFEEELFELCKKTYSILKPNGEIRMTEIEQELVLDWFAENMQKTFGQVYLNQFKGLLIVSFGNS